MQSKYTKGSTRIKTPLETKKERGKESPARTEISLETRSAKERGKESPDREREKDRSPTPLAG